jgi:hypothetical protein
VRQKTSGAPKLHRGMDQMSKTKSRSRDRPLHDETDAKRALAPALETARRVVWP